MKQKKGFSIVEILVALGIVGTVTAISVPNYTKMQRASKKAEAQSSLGNVYISEKAFYLQWRYYTVDLVHIGAVPEGTLTYNVGFHKEGEITSTTSDYKGPSVNVQRNSFRKICGQKFGSEEGASNTSTSGTSTGGTSKDGKQCAFQYKFKKADSGYKGFEPPHIGAMPKRNEYDAKQKTFKAGAIANLIDKKDSKDCQDNECDMWSINQHKQVRRECDTDDTDCPY